MAALVIIRLSVMNGREADKLKEVQEGEGEVSVTLTTRPKYVPPAEEKKSRDEPRRFHDQ